MGVNEHWWGSPSTGLVPGLHPEGLDKAGKPPIRVCGGTVTLKPARECLPMPRSLLHSHRRRKPFLEGEDSAPSGALCAYLSAPVHAILGSLWVSHGSQPLVLSRLELIWGLQHAVPGKERSSSGSSVRGKKHRSVSVAPRERVPQHRPWPGFVSELSTDGQGLRRNQEQGISSQILPKAALLTASFVTA